MSHSRFLAQEFSSVQLSVRKTVEECHEKDPSVLPNKTRHDVLLKRVNDCKNARQLGKHEKEKEKISDHYKTLTQNKPGTLTADQYDNITADLRSAEKFIKDRKEKMAALTKPESR